MSSLNRGIKLFLKKQQVRLYRHGPDFYIFESKAMRESAYKGRGIPKEKTTVCYLGIDTEKFKPNPVDYYYAHNLFNIPKNHKLIFYSGHFEQRKGIAVIANAVNILAEQRRDVTFILFGNKAGEERPYFDMLNECANRRVIFGGYRSDLDRIHRSCYAGVIASTGWDSFTVSALEMQSSGLPLLVSDLQGLKETIEEDNTGYSFPPGDHLKLSQTLDILLDQPQKRERMSKSARDRVCTYFSLEKQTNQLIDLLKKLSQR